MRVCDRCGSRQAPFFPRKRSEDGESMLCNLCKSLEDSGKTAGLVVPEESEEWPWPGCPDCGAKSGEEHAEDCGVYDKEVLDQAEAWVSHVRQGVAKIAHDSGEGETIAHCPFCGSGQVLGKSDGTAQCQFCKRAFTVQVQPSHSGVPQVTEEGPYDNPEMPGPPHSGEEPEEGEGEGDVDGEFEEAMGEEGEESQEDEEELPEFFSTRKGERLSGDDYLAHLALKHGENREGILAIRRRSRR